MNIGYGKTAQSPLQGQELAMFIEGRDEFVMNRDRLLDAAIIKVDHLKNNYSPTYRGELSMPGRNIWQKMKEWLMDAHKKGFLTPHDVTTGTQIAMIVTGGDIDEGTIMNEDDIFGLERKAFLSLAKTKETKQRIKHMLAYGKPLRN